MDNEKQKNENQKSSEILTKPKPTPLCSTDSSNPILVTGGAGFIGSHLVDYLLNLGYDVVSLDNGASAMDEVLFRQQRLKILKVADIRNVDSVISVMEEFETPPIVVHLAAASTQPAIDADRERGMGTNINGTKNIYTVAKDFKVPHVLFASSAATYSGVGEYADTKRWGEKEGLSKFEGSDTVFTAMRFFNVFGNGQNPDFRYAGVLTRWRDAIKAGKPIHVCGDGSNLRDYIHVSDIVRGIAWCIETQVTGCVDLGTGVGRTTLQLAKFLKVMSHRNVEIVQIAGRDFDSDDSVASIFPKGWSPTANVNLEIVKLLE